MNMTQQSLVLNDHLLVAQIDYKQIDILLNNARDRIRRPRIPVPTSRSDGRLLGNINETLLIEARGKVATGFGIAASRMGRRFRLHCGHSRSR
jgi:hypothetical protein